MSQNQFIVIDDIQYHADRPSSCRKCYFWKNRKAGCILGKENCYCGNGCGTQEFPCIHFCGNQKGDL